MALISRRQQLDDEAAHGYGVPVVRQYGGDIAQTYCVPVEEVVRGIRSGVRKVNIDTDIRLAMTAALRRGMAEKPSEFDPRKFQDAARLAASGIRPITLDQMARRYADSGKPHCVLACGF